MQPISRDPFQSQLSESRRPDDVQSGTGIKVSGNTISWPSGGWHEVQYASSFNTVSEGGQSATLDPGIYNVINHTTGERFENIQVGQNNDSFTARFAAQPAQSERLLGLTSAQVEGSTASDDPRPQVPETIYDGHTSIQLESGATWEDTFEDARNFGNWGAAAGALDGARTGAGPVGIAVGAAVGYSFGFLSMVGANTDIVTEHGSIPNDMVDQTSTFDPDSNETTTNQSYRDDTYIRSRYNHDDGSIVTNHQDASGSVTRTVTTYDVDSSNSPRTEVTTRPDGTQITVAISPTGGRYVVEPEPEPAPGRPSRIGTNQNSDNDSNSHGSSSHSSGGLSSGTGNQTSNNPHTA